MTPDGRITRRTRTLNVRIPKGIKQGQKIRLAGQGGQGIGGEPGDLYLEIEFSPHRHYRVEGADVYLDLPVAPWEAGLGATVKIPTPAGTVDLKVPAGSQQGRKLRLKGRGIPAKTPGDLYLVLQIALAARQRPEVQEDVRADAGGDGLQPPRGARGLERHAERNCPGTARYGAR